MRKTKALLTLAAALLLGDTSPALAQGAIQQSGAVTPFHLSSWFTNGYLMDGGVAQTPYVNALGLFNGANCPLGVSSQPSPGLYTLPNSLFSICQTDSATTFKFYGVNGQATPSVLFDIGGTVYPFPTTTGQPVAELQSIAALRDYATTISDGSSAYVAGYRTSADGGEGLFVYVASDTTSADNGGTIIVDDLDRRWYRDLQGLAPTPNQFGAYGDGTHVDTTAVRGAIGASLGVPVRLVGGETYLVDQALTLATGADALGFTGIGGVATLKASGLSASTDFITIGSASNLQPILENVTVDEDNVGRDAIVLLAGDHVRYKNVFVKNAGRDAVVGYASGGAFIQNWTLDDLKINIAGRNLVRLETAGSGGSYINSINLINNEWRGVGAGGNPLYVKAAGTVMAAQVSSVVGDVDIDFQNRAAAQADPKFIHFVQDTQAGTTGNIYNGWHITRGGWENTGDAFSGSVLAPLAYADLAGSVGDLTLESMVTGSGVSLLTTNIQPVKIDAAATQAIRLRIAAGWAAPSILRNADALYPATAYVHVGRYGPISSTFANEPLALFLKQSAPTDQNDGTSLAAGREHRENLAASTAGQIVTVPEVIRDATVNADDLRIVHVILGNRQYDGSGNKFVREYTLYISHGGGIDSEQTYDNSTANMITSLSFAVSGNSLVLTITTGTAWAAGGGYGPLHIDVESAGFIAP